jgi:hypothetical protein
MCKLHRLLRLPGERRLLLIRALWTLTIWRLGLWLFPLRSLRQQACGSALSRIPSGVSKLHQRLPRPDLAAIAWAIESAARHVPRATCLVQALAARSMLRRAGYASELHIGVLKGPERDFDAHAWLQCENRVVVGGSELRRYTPLMVWEETP